MKVNRLGHKILTELGYRSLMQCHEANDLGCSYYTFYEWCTRKSAPYDISSLAIDKLAAMLDTTRNDILNMIASEPTFNVVPTRGSSNNGDNLLKIKRAELGITAKELGEIIGCSKQMVTDIENGKRADFPTTDIAKNYIELLGISFTQFKSTTSELTKAANKRDYERKKNNKEEKIKRNSPSDDMDNVDDSVREELESENPYVSIFKKMGEQPTDRIIENPDIEITEVDIPEEPHTPFQDACKVLYGLPRTPSKAVLSEVTINKVMELIYGQVDYETYTAVEEILRGSV